MENKDSTEFIQQSNLVEKKIGHNKLQIEVDNLSETLKEKEQQIEEYKSQITALSQKCSSLEGLNAQLSAEKISLTEQVQSAQASLQTSVSADKLEESLQNISQLQSTNTQITEELNSYKQIHQNTQAQLTEALGLLDEYKLSTANLQVNFDQLSSEYAISIEQSTSYKNEINSLQNNIETQLSEINSLKDQITHSKSVALELNSVIEEKTKEIEILSSSTPVIPEIVNSTVIKGKSVRALKVTRSRR